jgi:hypothetical protein
MRDGIGCNFFDRGPDRQFIPGVMDKRAMTTEDNHGVKSPPWHIRSWSSHEGSKDRRIKRNVSKIMMHGKPTAPSAFQQKLTRALCRRIRSLRAQSIC